jgi:hypothetical protein
LTYNLLISDLLNFDLVILDLLILDLLNFNLVQEMSSGIARLGSPHVKSIKYGKPECHARNFVLLTPYGSWAFGQIPNSVLHWAVWFLTNLLMT